MDLDPRKATKLENLIIKNLNLNLNLKHCFFFYFDSTSGEKFCKIRDFFFVWRGAMVKTYTP